MQIDVVSPQLQTLLFSAMFLVALLLTMRRAERTELFPSSLTRELKGLAILMVIFGHIGFVLSKDRAFLQPLSIMAGVGVNLFLFLSGLGLTISYEKSHPKPAEFYRRRLKSVMVPLWITLTVLYIADLLVLKTGYPLATIVESYLGIYPSARPLTDFNSPLWYITFLLSYYAVFPYLYRKHRPYVSALLILVSGALFAVVTTPLMGSTVWLYAVHLLAFPLGLVVAQQLKRLPKRPVTEHLPLILRVTTALMLAAIVVFTAVHSGVGHWYEQPVSIITMLAVFALFVVVPVRFGFLDLFGKYSYEIYLFHWPLLYRYDVLYKHFPPYLATALYLLAFVALGWALQRVTSAFIAERKTNQLKQAYDGT